MIHGRYNHREEAKNRTFIRLFLEERLLEIIYVLRAFFTTIANMYDGYLKIRECLLTNEAYYGIILLAIVTLVMMFW